MALIKCPECGKDVSDTIASCIHCGFVLKKAEERTEQHVQPEIELQKDCNEIVDSTDNSSVTTVPKSSIFKFIIWSIVAIVIVFFFIVAIAPKPGTGSNINSTTTTTKAPAPEIDPIAIFADYHKNEITAEEKHIGRRYKITDVKISSINEDYVYITQKIDMGQYCIKLIYNKSQYEYVKTLETGDTVTFEGVLTNILFGSIFTPELTFEDVVFVQQSE